MHQLRLTRDLTYKGVCSDFMRYQRRGFSGLAQQLCGVTGDPASLPPFTLLPASCRFSPTCSCLRLRCSSVPHTCTEPTPVAALRLQGPSLWATVSRSTHQAGCPRGALVADRVTGFGTHGRTVRRVRYKRTLEFQGRWGASPVFWTFQGIRK